MDLRDILKPENLALPVCAGILTQVARNLFAGLDKTRLGARLLPLVPFAIAITLAMLGVGTAGLYRERFLLGVMAGSMVGVGFKVLKTTVWGRGLLEVLGVEETTTKDTVIATQVQTHTETGATTKPATGAAAAATPVPDASTDPDLPDLDTPPVEKETPKP